MANARREADKDTLKKPLGNVAKSKANSFCGKMIEDLGQCLVSKDVYEAIGYDKENGVKAIQRLVPEKYKIQFGDTQVDLEECVDNSFHTQPNTMLLKEPGLYCFLLRCKRDEAKLFRKWIVETVLPQEVRKLASADEEKDATIALLSDDLRERDNQTQAIKYKNVALQAQKDVYQAQLQKYQDIITCLEARYVPHAKNPGKDNIIINIVWKHTTSANDK